MEIVKKIRGDLIYDWWDSCRCYFVYNEDDDFEDTIDLADEEGNDENEFIRTIVEWGYRYGF